MASPRPHRGEPAPSRSPGVLRIMTAGSVDDGKSTLIGRLLHDARAVLADQLAQLERASRRRGHSGIDLSLLTDGLEAEREQGITIDVAYRYFATARRKFIIADAPGHEQYTRNMVTAATSADAAVILVDAIRGVRAQTRRHALIASLLGIRHLVIAVNKMDGVRYARERFEALRAAVIEFSAPLAVPDLQFIPMSALRGDMVTARGQAMPWYRGPTLLEALERIATGDQAECMPVRFPVQAVIRDPNGGPRRYAGRVDSGVIAPGDRLLVCRSGHPAKVERIMVMEGPREQARAGDSVALVLESEIDVARGDLLAGETCAPRARRAFDARLCWLAGTASTPGQRLLVRHGTATVRGAISRIDARIDIDTLAQVAAGDALSMNDVAEVSIRTAQPLYLDAYDENRRTGCFVLIDEANNQTVAAGMVRR